MATLRCPCGTLLNNHADNNETEGFLLTNQDLFEYDRGDWDDAAQWPPEAGRGVWECHSCGRLAVNWPLRSMSNVKWYLPEDGQPGRLMARTCYETQWREPATRSKMPNDPTTIPSCSACSEPIPDPAERWPAFTAGTVCQVCWEALSSRLWWAMVQLLPEEGVNA